MYRTRTVKELETDLVGVEAQISQLRCEQHVLVNELDKAQAPQTDGSRSMVEWVQSHMDVKTDTARDLVFAARRFKWNRGVYDRMLDHGATFDRTVSAVKLADSGATAGEVEASFGRDLAGVSRLISRRKHVTRTDERKAFAERFFTIQPNLDESSYRMWGQAPGVIGRTIDKAISDRADQLEDIAGGLPTSRGQRQLDALTAMAQDSLGGTTSDGSDAGQVTVFVDARADDPLETTAEVEYGPRVGPDTVEQLLCGGRAQIIGLDDNGIPVVTSPATRDIPPAIRHHVTHRDGGCVIDGCHSRYRLQPHHVIRFAEPSHMELRSNSQGTPEAFPTIMSPSTVTATESTPRLHPSNADSSRHGVAKQLPRNAEGVPHHTDPGQSAPSVALRAISPPASIDMTNGTVPSSVTHAIAEIVPTTIASDAMGIRLNQFIVLRSPRAH